MADRQTAYSVSLFGSTHGDDRQDGTSPARVEQALVDFIMDFHLDNVFIYRYAKGSRLGSISQTYLSTEIKFAKMC